MKILLNHPSSSFTLFSDSLNLCEYFIRIAHGRLLHPLKMHGRSGATLSCGSQVSRIPKHFGKRYKRSNDLRAAWSRFGFFNFSASAHKVTVDRAHVFVRRYHLDAHDWLKQHRLRFSHGVLKCERTRDMERALVRIDFMVVTVQQSDPDIYKFVACQEATLQRILDSLFDRLDVFLRDRTAGNFVFEDKAFAGGRLDLDLDVAKLTAAARLLLIDFFARRTLSDGLAISDLRLAYIRLHAKLTLHAIDDDLQMQLAHACDDSLARFLISRHIKGRIFLRQTV